MVRWKIVQVIDGAANVALGIKKNNPMKNNLINDNGQKVSRHKIRIQKDKTNC